MGGGGGRVGWRLREGRGREMLCLWLGGCLGVGVGLVGGLVEVGKRERKIERTAFLQFSWKFSISFPFMC